MLTDCILDIVLCNFSSSYRQVFNEKGVCFLLQEKLIDSEQQERH